MIVSACCKDDVYVLIDYYVCGNCHFPCRAVTLKMDNDKECQYDTGITREAERNVDRG